ncbi:Hypothetical predicted protein, partial [Paramuricea clavata]
RKRQRPHETSVLIPNGEQGHRRNCRSCRSRAGKVNGNLLANDVDVTSNNIFNEQFCLAVSTPARVLKPIDRGEAAKELRNCHWEHEEAISNLESTKASSEPTNENLHRGLPILHTAKKSHSPSGSIDKSNNGASEIRLLKSKLEKFADNVTTKLTDLAYKLNSIKENRPYSIAVLENVIEELKKEKVDLCKANDELRKHNTSMTYTITELSISNKNLENEKSSLLTALQLIQNDYNQSSIKSNTTEKPWNIVNNHKPNQIQLKSSHNSTTYMPVVKPPINRNVINCSSVNRYEILSDSDLAASAKNEEPILTHDEPTMQQEKVNTNKSATKKPIASSKKTRKIASPSNVPDNSASAKQSQASSEPSATPVRSTKAKRNTDLLAQPWEQIVLESYTDSMWALWKKLFLEVLDKHAPVQRIKKRKSGVPWLTGEIKKIIFERDKLKHEAMVTGSRAAWDKYKSTRNKVNIALRQAKTDYFRTKISNQNNNPKEAWKKSIINLLGRSPGNTVVNELKFNDTKITSPEEIANTFINIYFTDIGPNLASSIDDTDITFDRFVKPAT